MQILTRATLRIPSRYCGPPGLANGGIAAGALAAAAGLAGDVEVTLLKPIPLDTELEVEDTSLLAGGETIAVARPADLTAWVPIGVEPADARAAAAAFPLEEHFFPGCYVCGHRHPDGLRIHPGPTPSGRLVAAPWRVPDAAAVETVWAALDCPSGWAAYFTGSRRPAVLGRLAVRIVRMPDPAEELTVTGWLVVDDGRKALTGSALHDPDGGLVAKARATWVHLDAARAAAFGAAS